MGSLAYKFVPDTRHDDLFLSYRTNYKQALKACDDLMTKNPNDPHALYWRLRLWHQTGNLQVACDLVQRIASEKKLIIPLDLLIGMSVVYKQILLNLYPTKKTVYPPKEIESLWEIATPTKPTVPFMEELVFCGVACEWWSLAIKGFTLLRKQVPTNSRYYYGYIVYSNLERQQLQSEYDTLPDDKQAEMALSEKLAHSFANIALKKTIQKQQASVLITTSRDVRVVIQTLRDHPQHALNLVSEITKEDSPLYLFSPLLGGNLEFLMDALSIWKANGRYQDIWDFCTEMKDGHRHIRSQLLTRYRHDSTILDALLDAAIGLSTDQSKAEFEDFLSVLLSDTPPTREAMHLALKWHSKTAESQEKLLETCIRFWKDNRGQESCFNDLKRYFESFTPANRTEFMKSVLGTYEDAPSSDSEKRAIMSWMYQRMSYLKFRYLNLGLETEWKPDTTTVAALEAMTLETFALTQMSAQTGIHTPLSTVVLISSLLWRRHSLSTIQSDEKITKEVLQILAITFQSIKSIDYNAQANTIATYINILFGLGSHAIKNYATLKVKNLMSNALSHILFTRLSVSHPFDCKLPPVEGSPSDRAWNAIDQFTQTFSFESRAQSRIDFSLGQNLDKFYPDKVEELFELKEKLKMDMHYAARLIDFRRLLRIRGAPLNNYGYVNGQLNKYLSQECYTVDNRDMNTLPNYEISSIPSFEKSVQSDDVVGHGWIKSMMRIEMISDLLWDSKLVFSAPIHLHNLEQHSCWVRDSRANPTSGPRLNQPEEVWNQADGCNEVEKVFQRGWGLLEPFAVFIGLPIDTPYPIKPKDLTKLLKSIQSFVDSESKRYTKFSFPKSPLSSVLLNIPTQRSFLNHAFYFLEFLQAVVKMTISASSAVKSNQKPAHPMRGAVTAEALAALSKSAFQIAKTIQTYAQEWARTLKNSQDSFSLADVRGLLSADGTDIVGEQIAALLTDGQLHLFIREILSSAIDSLEGVTKVQVRR